MSDAHSQAMISEPWARSHEKILKEVGVSTEKGLDSREVRKRRKRFGRNRLKRARKKSVWRILINQFKSLIILLLAVAAAISFALGEWMDGIAISVAIVLNGVIGFVSELKAVRSMEALEELGSTTARLRRDGAIQEVPSSEIVPGDIVLIERGDLVPADIRLIKASKIQADESALTGESFPVGKSVETVEPDAPLGDRTNMLYNGTSVVKGAGEGVVVAIGMATEVGNIASLAEEAEEEITPLEKRLNRLGNKLIYTILLIAFLIGITGVLTGKEMFLMFEVAVALAVAAIPEGLPIVATISLARGMWRMARQNALVNRLSAVETLGSTNVIFTDKTGTLTENQMVLSRLALVSGDVAIGDAKEFKRDGKPIDPKVDEYLREALEIGVLCNKAFYEGEDGSARGDPVEVALLAAARKAGMSREKLLEEKPEEREEPFDSETKMMATYHRMNGERFLVAIKGAPEVVLDSCSRVGVRNEVRELEEGEKKQWSNRNHQLAQEGLRVLALAEKTTDSIQDPPYENLTFLGLAGFWDPPRKEIPGSIASCHRAGIRVIMVTGDHAMTAKSIGEEIGLVERGKGEVLEGKELKDPDTISDEEQRRLLRIPIFARVSPEQKLDLIRLHQKNGSIVAMTGDGVNDAPALRKADIGVAMGKRGTQVAREAADMVLQDDAFSTIVHAVGTGRVIFDNIRRFVVYLLSGNMSQVLIITLALLANAPLPILPLQILYLNMLTDVFPALALGLGEGNPRVMDRGPRDPNEQVLTPSHWKVIGGYSVLIAAPVLGAFALAFHWLELNKNQAVTVSFLTLAFARLWHVFNMREHGSPFFKNDVMQNPFVWGSQVLCTGLLLVAVYIPVIASILGLVRPALKEWALILTSSIIPLVVGQVLKSCAPEEHGVFGVNKILKFFGVRDRIPQKGRRKEKGEEICEGIPEPACEFVSEMLWKQKMHEEAMYNSRLNAFLTSESLLLIAFAVLFDRTTENEIVLIGIAILGILLSALWLHAQQQQNALLDKLKEWLGKTPPTSESIGKPHANLPPSVSRLLSSVLPSLFGVLWVVLLYSLFR